MLTEKSNVQTDQGELDLLFNIFSLPSFLTSLGAPPLETRGKQGMFIASLTLKVLMSQELIARNHEMILLEDIAQKELALALLSKEELPPI